MNESRIDWVTVLRFVGVMLTLFALFVAEKFFPNDGQMFQVVAGLVTAFSGALFTRIKPLLSRPDDSATATAIVDTPAAPLVPH
jgi:uncharacterized membrane protein YjjP (DUF1212 family)